MQRRTTFNFSTNSASEAIERFEASVLGQIGFVLTDINKPEMTSLEATAAIRARTAVRPDDVISITANFDFEKSTRSAKPT